MRYRWSNHIMTRNSGCLTIYCEDEEQATNNVKRYLDSRLKDNKTISFLSLSGLANIVVMDEIIAVTCCDVGMMFEIHREEMIMKYDLQKQINLLSDDGGS